VRRSTTVREEIYPVAACTALTQSDFHTMWNWKFMHPGLGLSPVTFERCTTLD